MSNILFLQGPLGPFFGKLSRRFTELGNQTFKINFNGGDAFFSEAEHVFNYRGNLSSWSRYLSMFVRRNQIHAIVVYGDCRKYHSIAKEICHQQSIEFWAFEEGYIRPNFITLEKGGVNANSSFKITNKLEAKELARLSREYQQAPEHIFGQTFFQRLIYGVTYYTAKSISQIWLKNDGHHRNYSAIQEAKCWLKSIKRKWVYKFTQRKLDNYIIDNYANNYFFVPLQVHCDSQILAHSDFKDVSEFIRTVMLSFSQDAPAETILVFKHHPMDRGFCHYGQFIHQMAAKLNISERVIYGHELHLPTMLKYCRGTITVNSTVGLSSLHHYKPTKVLGRANYDIPGLTSVQPLSLFWRNPCPVDGDFFQAYKAALKKHTQINGSFYRDIDVTCTHVINHLQMNQVRIEPDYFEHVDNAPEINQEQPLPLHTVNQN